MGRYGGSAPTTFADGDRAPCRLPGAGHVLRHQRQRRVQRHVGPGAGAAQSGAHDLRRRLRRDRPERYLEAVRPRPVRRRTSGSNRLLEPGDHRHGRPAGRSPSRPRPGPGACRRHLQAGRDLGRGPPGDLLGRPRHHQQRLPPRRRRPDAVLPAQRHLRRGRRRGRRRRRTSPGAAPRTIAVRGRPVRPGHAGDQPAGRLDHRRPAGALLGAGHRLERQRHPRPAGDLLLHPTGGGASVVCPSGDCAPGERRHLHRDGHRARQDRPRHRPRPRSPCWPTTWPPCRSAPRTPPPRPAPPVQFTIGGTDQFGNALPDQTAASTVVATPVGGGASVSCAVRALRPHRRGGLLRQRLADRSRRPASDATTLTVTPAALDRLEISPDDATTVAGNPVVYTVTGYDEFDNVRPAGSDGHRHEGRRRPSPAPTASARPPRPAPGRSPPPTARSPTRPTWRSPPDRWRASSSRRTSPPSRRAPTWPTPPPAPTPTATPSVTGPRPAPSACSAPTAPARPCRAPTRSARPVPPAATASPPPTAPSRARPRSSRPCPR